MAFHSQHACAVFLVVCRALSDYEQSIGLGRLHLQHLLHTHGKMPAFQYW